MIETKARRYLFSKIFFHYAKPCLFLNKKQEETNILPIFAESILDNLYKYTTNTFENELSIYYLEYECGQLNSCEINIE